MAILKADRHLADQISQNLAEVYQITLIKDWGELITAETGEDWQKGEWSLEKLYILQQAITDLSNAMVGPANLVQKLGPVTIRLAEMKHRGLASKGEVKFTTGKASIDLWTVVHELAHVWDARFGWRLSEALQTYTGGYTNWFAMQFKKWRGDCDEQLRQPGCNRFGYFYSGPPPAGSDGNFNRKEDFAESVAGYVYPTVVQTRVDRFKNNDRYRELLYYSDYTQTKRWAFVDGLVKGTIVV